jgi:hypothetical protein
VVHLQPIILLCGFSAITLWRDATRLRHLQGVPRDFGLFFFANTVPVTCDMLIAE